MTIVRDLVNGDNAIYSLYVEDYGSESADDGRIAERIIGIYEDGKDGGEPRFSPFAAGGLLGTPRYLKDRTGVAARLGLGLESEDDYRWSDPDGDMAELSRSFPDVMFRVHAQCRSGRALDVYFRNGAPCGHDATEPEDGRQSFAFGIASRFKRRKKDKPATFRLSQETLRRLDDYSGKTGVSKSFVVDAAIAAYLDGKAGFADARAGKDLGA